MIENLDIKIIDQTITDQNITIIKIDHATIYRIEIQVITIDKETTLSHPIGKTSQQNYRSSTPKHQRQIN